LNSTDSLPPDEDMRAFSASISLLSVRIVELVGVFVPQLADYTDCLDGVYSPTFGQFDKLLALSNLNRDVLAGIRRRT
jgi:hypothetical protein